MDSLYCISSLITVAGQLFVKLFDILVVPVVVPAVFGVISGDLDHLIGLDGASFENGILLFHIVTYLFAIDRQTECVQYSNAGEKPNHAKAVQNTGDKF